MSVKKEYKKIIYLGYPGDRGSPFEFHGIKFGAREVQPVTDEVYEAVKHMRGFATVNSVRNSVVGFAVSGNTGWSHAETNTLVQ